MIQKRTDSDGDKKDTAAYTNFYDAADMHSDSVSDCQSMKDYLIPPYDFKVSKIYEVPPFEPNTKLFPFSSDSPKHTLICNVDVRAWLIIQSILVSMVSVPVVWIYMLDWYALIVIPILYNLVLALAASLQYKVMLKTLRVFAWILLVACLLYLFIFPSYQSHNRGYYQFWRKTQDNEILYHGEEWPDFSYTTEEVIEACLTGLFFASLSIPGILFLLSQLYLIEKVLEIKEYQKTHDVKNPV